METKRLVALDVFRGMTIVFMILVNTPGSWTHVYPYLLHAKWDGFMPPDFVFPFFLFIIGVSMSFSFAKYEGKLDASLSRKIIQRVIIIFLIGLMLNYFPFYNKSISDLRIMGVLQRIALAYGLAAFICVKVSDRHLWKVGIIMLLGYWVILIQFGNENPLSLEGNITTAIDAYILGTSHMYKGFGIPFDPEGLLGTLSAAVSIITGFLIGKKIQQNKDRNLLVKNLLLIGLITVSVGLLWGLVYPINKPIWSGSYVIFTTGVACIVLGFLIEFIDIRKHDSWIKPFLIFGINPMAIFVFSILLVKVLIYVIKWKEEEKIITGYGWLYQNIFVVLSPNNLKFASLFFAISTVILCWILGLYLYKKKIIIKI